MKILPFALVFLSLLLSGCFLRLPEQEVRLTTLPTPPHNRPVKIFFPGESLPAKPYVKIKVLSLKRNSSVPTTNLVQELARRAQEEGADAILVMGKNVYTETASSTTMTTDSTGSSTNTSTSSSEWQDVSALAIKYVEGLDYLSDYVREQRLLRWADGGWQPAATGQVFYKSPTVWQPATGDELAAWQTYELDGIPPKGVKYSRAKDGARSTYWFSWPPNDRKLLVHANAESRIEQVEIAFQKGVFRREKSILNYTYDPAGRLTGRTLDTPDLGTLSERRFYDDRGKILSVEWKQSDGQPFLKVEYVYFQPDDARSFLN